MTYFLRSDLFRSLPAGGKVGRREVLRLIAGGALALSAGGGLAGCGGGGGGGGTPPPLGTGTQALSGTVNPAEVGGAGWAVQSAYQLHTVTTAQGAFTTTVSSQGPQLLAVTDGGGALRALGISQPALTGLTLGAASTATALVFLTIGILTTDPTEGARRVAQIQALSAFPPLVAALAQSLPTATVPALAQTAALGALVQACVQQMLGAAGQARGRVLSRETGLPVGTSGVTAAFGTGPVAAQPVLLSNTFYRKVYVIRQNLDGSGNEILPQEPGFYVDGATSLSWGSLFRGTVGEAGQKTDIDDLTFPPGIAEIAYWINGPGLGASSDALPAGVDMSGSYALLLSVLFYVFFPLMDLSGGTNAVLSRVSADETLTPKVLDLLVNAIGEAAPTRELLLALAEGDLAAASVAAINVVIAAVGLELSLAPLLGLVAEVAEGIAFVLTLATAALAAANLVGVLPTWLSYPENKSLRLTVSSQGVIVQ